MKIIDKFGQSDFYDHAHAGIDEQVVFHRSHEPSQPLTTDDFPFDPKLSLFEGGLGGGEDDHAPYSLGYVFVAGVVYPVVMVDHIDAYDFEELTTSFRWARNSHRWDHVYVYQGGIEYLYDGEVAKERLDASPWFQKARKATQDRARLEMHDHFHTQKPEWADWLARYGIVTGILYRRENKDLPAHEYDFDHDLGVRTWVNVPYLKYFGFQDVRNAFDVNQDIARYVSGVLPAMANPMVEISDPDKVRKGGFDTKMGFRKRPEKAS